MHELIAFNTIELALSEKQTPQVIEKIEKPKEQMDVLNRASCLEGRRCRVWSMG